MRTPLAALALAIALPACSSTPPPPPPSPPPPHAAAAPPPLPMQAPQNDPPPQPSPKAPASLPAAEGGNLPPAPAPAPTATAAAAKPRIGAASATSAEVPDIGPVLDGLEPAFQRCYQRALASSPAMSGSLTVVVTLGGKGDVQKASAKGVRGLSPDVVECILARVRAARFSPPPAGTITFSFPIGAESR